MIEIATLSPPPKSTKIPENVKLDGDFKDAIDADIWPKAFSYSMSSSWFNQAWIESYVKTIMTWLYDSVRNQTINLNKPIYILQAQASEGQFGLALLDRLNQILEQSGFENTKICYVFSDSDPSRLAKLIENPYFIHFNQQGKAETLYWKLDEIEGLPKDYEDARGLDFTKNAVVFIANGVLSQLPQMLLKVHYQDLYLAEVAKLAPDSESSLAFLQSLQEKNFKEKRTNESFHHAKLAYRWKKKNIDQLLDQCPKQIQEYFSRELHSYVQQGVCRTFALPVKAQGLLMKLEQSFLDGSLFLTSDFSIKPESNGDISLPNTLSHLGLSLPLNLTFLKSSHSKNLNVLASGTQHNKFTSMTINSVRSDKQYKYTQKAFYRYFKVSSPVDYEHALQSFANTSEVLDDGQMLSFLCIYQYEPKLLRYFLPSLIERGVQTDTRLAWHEVLDNVWRGGIQAIECEEFVFKLGLFSIQISHWQLARESFVYLMEFGEASTACLHNLALVEHSTGNEELAIQYIQLALEQSPEDKQAVQLAGEIDSYQKTIQSYHWFQDRLIEKNSDLIKLIPLGKHHLSELYLQYRRTDISERLRSYQLNQFEKVEYAWQLWQHEMYHNEKANFAVVHENFGYIGGVVLDISSIKKDSCIHTNSSSAYLSFWIGTDYQNRGFGTRAVELVIALEPYLVECGICELKTSAWEHNFPSRRILEKRGFIKVGSNEAKGGELEVFYRLKLRRSKLKS